MTTNVVVPVFNYDDLSAEERAVVEEESTQIRQTSTRLQSLVQQTAVTAWQLGQKLVRIRDLIGEDRFPDWLQCEFPGWSRSSAYNFMRIYTTYDRAQVEEIQIGLKTMYLLAQDNTPETARNEAIAASRAGERVTYNEARVLIDTHRESAPDALRQQVEEAGWKIVSCDCDTGFYGSRAAQSVTTETHVDEEQVIQAIIAWETQEIQVLTEARGGTYQAIQANGMTVGHRLHLPGHATGTYRIAEAHALLERIQIAGDGNGLAPDQHVQDTTPSHALLALGQRLGDQWSVRVVDAGQLQALHMSSGYGTSAGSPEDVVRMVEAAQPLLADLAAAGWAIYTDSRTRDLVGSHSVHGTFHSTTLDSLHQMCLQQDGPNTSDASDPHDLVAEIGGTLSVSPGVYTVTIGDVRHTCHSRGDVAALVRHYRDALDVRLPRDPTAAAQILAQHYDVVVLVQALQRSRGG